MKSIKNVLVALDGAAKNKSLQQVTALFVNKLGARKVLGIHVIPVLKIADTVTVDARHPLTPAAPAVELVRSKIEREADFLKKCCKQAEVGVAIREGQPYNSMVRLTEEMDADLLILGRREHSSQSGITAQKIARKVKSDVLFVPEGRSSTIERIMVAIDFSDDSARAVEKALFLADHLGLTQAVTCLNILDIPPISRIGEMDIYNLAGKSVLEISKERYEHFLDQYHLDRDRLEPLFVESWDANLGDTIRSTAHETGTDLLVLGAHGHGAIQRFFAGSVTENLVDGDKDHLIWVVR
ncbi:MAG: universal stress protein [Saprospiraceae bacterium]|nr:universal stress protein [Lewinella sp.]